MSRTNPAAITTALVAIAIALPSTGRAQGSVIDRAQRAIHDAATAGKKAVVNQANTEASSAVQNVATQDVADGAFSAAFSPWSASDGKTRVELARYSGSAYEVSSAGGRQILLCDNQGTIPWQASFTIKNVPNAATPVAAGRGGRAATASARGAGGASTGGGARGASSTAASSGPSAPSAAELEYRFPSPAVTVTLPTSGARSGNPGAGNLRVADASQTIFAGAAKVRFLQASVPGDTKPDVVDFGVAFKARVVTAAESATGCTALAKLPSMSASVATTRGDAPDAARGRDAPAELTHATSPAPAPGAAPSAGPTFTAGDVLIAKLDGMKLYADANDSAKVAVTVKKTDDMVYLGDEKNGFVHVQGSAGEGWIRKVLVSKKP